MSVTTNRPKGDVIEFEEAFYIRASSTLADDRTRVLLNGDTFAVFDRGGDIHPLGIGQQGLFHLETRHLSRLELRINGIRPLLLSSTIREDNVLFAIDITNPDLLTDSGHTLTRGTLHIFRAKFLTDSICYDRITVHNYGETSCDIDLSFEFEADFADIFEVRGEKRPRRGRRLPDEIDRDGVLIAYEGLDHIRRSTRIACSAETCSGRRRSNHCSASSRCPQRSQLYGARRMQARRRNAAPRALLRSPAAADPEPHQWPAGAYRYSNFQ